MSAALHVACGGDRRYLRHTAAMLSSVIENAGDLRVHAYYLHDPALRPRHALALGEWFRSRGGELELLPVAAERLEGLPGKAGHLTAGAWYRVFVPDLLPDVERVLYLDADVVAVDSLEPLWAAELAGGMVAAVTNVFNPWDADRGASLGMTTPYFNSGVLVMDLERMRASATRDAILDWARAHAHVTQWGDQDAVNAVLGPHRAELHPRWNCMNSFHVYPDAAAELFGRERYEEAIRRPGIRHFEGPSENKPWDRRCDRPGVAEYLRHRAATPWPKRRFRA